jgi:TrmH family RNA methyltransferase
MPIRIVQSKQNARLKELRKALAHPGKNARGLVGIEGPNLVQEAFRAGLRVDCIFAADEKAADAFEARTRAVEVLLVPGDQLRAILATESPQLVAALVQPPEWTFADLLKANLSPLILLLAGIQDPGNLGTILRSAEAFGANGAICLPGTVNAWNAKAVRASAGSIFRLPVLNIPEEDAVRELKQMGVRILTTAADGAQPVCGADLAHSVALVIGNEGNGVPAALAAKADGAVMIPCPGPVESLNAAVAASVLLYEAARQRSAVPHGPTKRNEQRERGGAR